MADAVNTDAGTRRQERRAVRRAQTQGEIVAAAWQIVREHGLAALRMRELADAAGMSPASLYSYFASKHDIYDAMFGEGYRDFLDLMRSVAEGAGGPEARVRLSAAGFFTFCTEDPARFLLLFQRTIPGFEPTAESYAIAEQVYVEMQQGLAAVGITDPTDVDLWTAVMTGLASQQLANDPGGDRWARLVQPAVDMLLARRPTTPHDTSATDRSEGTTT